jgi:hypothetical protein
MRKIILSGAAFMTLTSPAMAQAQKMPGCLTDSEASALFTFVIPEAIDGVSKKCSASLPESAFLRAHSVETVTRFRTAAASSWPAARAAFLKVGGGGDDAKQIAELPDSALQPFVAATIAQIVSKDLKPADCPKVDRFVAALAPIPAPNVAELITSLMILVGTKRGDDFRLC